MDSSSSNPLGLSRPSHDNFDASSFSCRRGPGSKAQPPSQPQERMESDSRFSCNICLDAVEEPVVTQCGHLYCWPCLFRWLEPGMSISERQSLHLGSLAVLENHDPSRRHCPVCKAPCCVSNLIPIYVRSSSSQSVVGSQASAASVLGGSTPAATADKDPVELSGQNECAVAQSNIREDTRENGYAIAGRNQSNTNLSEIDDKNSSSSTIATEQEEDDDDGATTEPLGTPLLVSTPPQNRETSQQASSSTSRPPPATALGALQRQRRTSPSPPEFPLSATLLVPNHGENLNSGDHRPRSLSENAVGVLQQQQQHQGTAASRTLALSQGLALTLHRALQPTGSTNSTAQAAAQAAASIVVPPLHRPEGFGNAAAMNTSVQEEVDPDATEFLSRVLLMLASFVILCLLLF
mmetsp:Transcript_995/g.1902  ORF Transcript_995/g.1902 Transcript_995/m.1902 type:complete len:408 (+) Transcript_995:206-1429(+)